MLHDTQLPEIPDYVARNMQKIEESGIGDLDLREVGRLLFDWEEKYGEAYGYEKCRETVEWLSENYQYFEQVKSLFLKPSDQRLQ
ncbi:MAG: hypothetical protein COV35_07720 [Alphaproteobacteria bacterium CG11_big_fil_rev_8_21_14_0_20_39_49]|nr:MAG: hypothetical protein COV35_07720 [Alphaproteobacteria bacterium CG11_big_fil_rev_8_21_14_0_20_39_49]